MEKATVIKIVKNVLFKLEVLYMQARKVQKRVLLSATVYKKFLHFEKIYILSIVQFLHVYTKAGQECNGLEVGG